MAFLREGGRNLQGNAALCLLVRDATTRRVNRAPAPLLPNAKAAGGTSLSHTDEEQRCASLLEKSRQQAGALRLGSA